MKLALTYISNSLSAALPTLFVQFTSAIRLSASQRTHGTLSCCAALIETANGLSQAKWAGRNRGEPNKTRHQRVAAEEILSRDLRCLVTLTNCAFHVKASHVCFFLFLSPVLLRMFQGEMTPHYRRRVAFICNWVSRKGVCGLCSVFGVANGQCRTNKLCRHKRRALEPFPPNSSLGSSFEKHISLQSLHASLKDEEI